MVKSGATQRQPKAAAKAVSKIATGAAVTTGATGSVGSAGVEHRDTVLGMSFDELAGAAIPSASRLLASTRSTDRPSLMRKSWAGPGRKRGQLGQPRHHERRQGGELPPRGSMMGETPCCSRCWLARRPPVECAGKVPLAGRQVRVSKETLEGGSEYAVTNPQRGGCR